MAWKLINRLNNVIDHVLFGIYGTPPPALSLLGLSSNRSSLRESQSSKVIERIEEFWKDGLLWAVPKSRRPLEKRWSRKFGFPDKHWKLLVPKNNLLVCPNCGHDHEAGLLCSKCYKRVKTETEEMQETIVNQLGLTPVEKEVVVIYEGENTDTTSEYWKGQRIVEMPKKRPAWFHTNLLQPTTQEPAETKDVKPDELA